MTLIAPDKRIEAAAQALREARQKRIPVPRISETYGIQNVAEAYAVAHCNAQHALQAGGRVSGKKIGLTSKTVQQQMGVDQPDYGVLLNDMEYLSGAELPMGRLIQPRAEGEIAFVVGRDLDEEGLSWGRFLRSIEYALPAIEIVDSAIANWQLTLVDTIADNASSGVYVLGLEPRKLGQVDLLSCGMDFRKNGVTESVGSGAACLGHPLLAAHWLARTMFQLGSPLKAGDVILSGALGPMFPLAQNDQVNLSISGLGSVMCRMGA